MVHPFIDLIQKNILVPSPAEAAIWQTEWLGKSRMFNGTP